MQRPIHAPAELIAAHKSLLTGSCRCRQCGLEFGSLFETVSHMEAEHMTARERIKGKGESALKK